IVQGLALVTFPAASAVFTDPQGFGFSSTQYGTMFLPQVLMAILSSSLASRLAGRHGLKAVLLTGLAGNLLSMAMLAASALLAGHPAAFPLVCLATGALGLGFGATVTALNSFGEAFFTERPDRAVLTLNALLGVGTALAPLL
ncbi:MFS transporter, partial [Corallococcus exiguus]|nr:MFS transporter [Corallococcus exiguus]